MRIAEQQLSGCGREPKGADGSRGGLMESTRWIEGDARMAERAQALPHVRQG
ncbi:hypothetical protein ACFQS6_23040 [Xanthomonas populi]|uniref:hypothetical protein n=1 Tax=Xanthomonas populi TaxID=53414 RepID=UPI0013048903|nr:hypothetical protein [Xanthomonas populi]